MYIEWVPKKSSTIFFSKSVISQKFSHSSVWVYIMYIRVSNPSNSVISHHSIVCVAQLCCPSNLRVYIIQILCKVFNFRSLTIVFNCNSLHMVYIKWVKLFCQLFYDVKDSLCFSSYMFSAKTLHFTIRPYAACLILQIVQTLFQVTWVVHGEYLEATVPELFRQFFRSGQAYGACRWLRSLQRQCEYMAVLGSSHVPSSSSSSGKGNAWLVKNWLISADSIALCERE